MHGKTIAVGMASLVAAILVGTGVAAAASVTLYDQDFEAPTGFVNGFGSGYRDLSQQQVNDLYGGQPAGFSFAQQFTVETAFLTGNQAFGTGYSDPSGQGGNHAVGMLSDTQPDLLGLSFNVASFDYFNLSIDVSSLGLDGPGGPFTTANSPPTFRFTLYDNPSGALTTGSGTVLGSFDLLGTASPIDTLDWTTGIFSFNTSNATNGNVTLQIDLLAGGYAVFDNMLITASDTPGEGIDDPTPVPEPGTLSLLLAGLAALRFKRKGRGNGAEVCIG